MKTDVNNLLNKPSVITTSRRLNANLIGLGTANNTQFSYLTSANSNLQIQLNDLNLTVTNLNTTVNNKVNTSTLASHDLKVM